MRKSLTYEMQYIKIAVKVMKMETVQHSVQYFLKVEKNFWIP